jgi:YD repeat-containing protein
MRSHISHRRTKWKFGNDLYQTWSYTSPLRRLSRVQVGTASALGSLFDRSYTYDDVGNVDTLVDSRAGQTQNFDYDHRDRLTHAWTTGSATNAYNENYAYNTLGNLTSKAGASYTYGTQSASCAYGALSNPHSVVTVGSTGYCYDLNGNMTSGAGRSYTWNTDNLPISISWTGGTESYNYDADGERVRKVVGGTTTVYLEGLWEEVAGGAARQRHERRELPAQRPPGQPEPGDGRRSESNAARLRPVGQGARQRRHLAGADHPDRPELHRAATGRDRPAVLSCALL